MKNKIFALVLALCMILTMTPGMAFADEEEALYAIWLQNGETPENGIINREKIDGIIDSSVGAALDIELGHPREVQYLCYKSGDDSYVVLNPTDASVEGDGLIVEHADDGRWIFRIDGKRSLDNPGKITVTENGKVYSMKYTPRLPGIGAYTSINFDVDHLLYGENFSYKELGEENQGLKTVYFAVDTDKTVTDIWLTGDFSTNNIQYEESEAVKKVTLGNRAFYYLEVQVSSNIISEEFEVRAKIADEENPWIYGYRITGNVLYRIPDNGDRVLGAAITDTRGNEDIRITPVDEDYCYFGVPTGNDDEFVIVKPYVSSDSKNKILLEQTSEDYPVYRVFAGKEAEVGETYYICASYQDVEYKIPVYYALPNVGVYTYSDNENFDPTKIDEEHLIKGNTFGYTEILGAEEEGMKTFYIVASVDAGNAGVELLVEEGSYSTDLLKIEPHKSEGDTPAYLKVKVSKEVYNEKLNVKMMVTGNDGSECWGNWEFWITGRLLYRIGFDGEDPNYENDQVVQTRNWSTEIDLSPAGGQYCYFAVPTEVPEQPDEYRIVEIDGDKIPEKIQVSQNDKNAAYDISASEDAELPGEYFIYATYNNVEYKIPVHYDLPRVGAYIYTGDEAFDATKISKETLIKSYEFKYSQIPASADKDGWKTIYFVSNIDADGGIVRLTLDSIENIKVEENKSSTLPKEGVSGTPAYLKVKVSKNISEEELRVRVFVDYDGWNDSWEEFFRITGNRLYRICVDEHTDLQIGDKIRTDSRDEWIYVEPNEEQYVFFGIPTEEDDVYEIVSAKVSEESKAALSLERKGKRNAAYILKSTEEAQSETYYMEASTKDGSTYKIPVACGGPSSGSGDAYVPADKTLLVCTKNGSGYKPITLTITDDYGGVEPAAQFFVGGDNGRTFYVLTTHEGTLTLKELNYYREVTGDAQKVTVSKVEGTYEYLETSYYVWEVAVQTGFKGELRAGFEFDGNLVTYQIDKERRPYTKFMWILDENYDESNDAQYSDDRIIVCKEKPAKATYDSRKDLEDIVCYTKELNLSRNLTEDANAIFVVYPVGNDLHSRSAIESGYMVEGSGYGSYGHDGGSFRKILSGEIYDYTSVGTLMIGSEEMQISKACLKNAYANNYLDTVFCLTEENSDIKTEGYASVYLQKGMNVVVTGAEEDAVTIDSNYNIVSEAVGNGQIMPPLSFEKQEDGTYAAFYPEALAQISDEGTGRYTSFNIKLEPGYVIEKITDNDNNMLGFTSSRRFLYSLLDENGAPIYEADKIKETGWTYGISGSANEENGNRSIIGVDHCVANYVPTYMEGMWYSHLGSDNGIRLFVDFLTGNNDAQKTYKAKQQAAYTEYTVYFDPEKDGQQNRIVFHVKKAEIGANINAKNNGSDFSIQTELAEMNDIDSSKIAEFLQALDFNGYSVLKVYDMTSNAATTSDEQGLYNVTIPQSELEQGTDLSEYKVVYFDEENGTIYPLEMETTYVEGKGIVFTTGHFSRYALLYKSKADPDPTPTPTPGGGAIAPIPSDVTTSGTADDKVTTAKTDVKTSEKTNADGTKETAAEVKVSAANQKEIIKQAKQNGSKAIILEVPASAAGSATSANVQLEKAFLDQLLKETNASLTIRTPFGDTTYTQDELKALLEKADGDTVTLTVSKADPAAEEAERIAQAKAAAKKAAIKARSSKTAKGSVKVVLFTDAETKAFLKSMQDMGYTVKYRFYRSTKKASGYKAMLTKDKPVYLNTSGKKGVKYYYKVQVRVYDENGKLITAIALKQCKYACRIWTK